MKILLVGASGVIGQAVHRRLATEHEVLRASRRSCEHQVDLGRPESIQALLEQVGEVDAIICTAGDGEPRPLSHLTDLDFHRAVHVQLMGQINLFRLGRKVLRPGGSVTLTSGTAAQINFPGAAAISMACAGLERFVQAAAHEEPQPRLNVVSPSFVKESMVLMGLSPEGGVSADDTATAYVQAVHGQMHGTILSPHDVLRGTP